MSHLQRLHVRPNIDELTPAEKRYVQKNFDVYAGEVIVSGQPISWTAIDEVEVAKAARTAGPSGWLVKYLVMGGERYHVGIYYGGLEAVLTNMTLNSAKYIVQTMAFYAPQSILYSGPEGLSPLVDY